MKLCVLTTSFPNYEGNVQSPFIYDICRGLVQQGVSVDVVCPRDGDAKREEIMSGVRVHRFSYFYPTSLQRLTGGGGIPSNLQFSFFAKLQLPLFFLIFFIRSMKYARNCDIIQCHWSFSALVGVFLKKLYQKPLVVTERGASANLAVQNRFARMILLYVLRHCDYVTANNQHHVDLFVQLGVPRNKLAFTPNGLNVSRFTPEKRISCRKKLDFSDKQKILVFVGWLIERKGLHVLFPALARIVNKQKNITCYIIGEGIWEQPLRRQVHTLGLDDVVVFLGTQPNEIVAEYVNAADAFVMPSFSEGRPNVVGEALAAGVPVVATDVNGTAEFFSLFPYGELVPPKNVTRLSQALFSVLSKRWNIAKHKQALHRFRTELTWKHCVERYLRLYKTLLS